MFTQETHSWKATDCFPEILDFPQIIQTDSTRGSTTSLLQQLSGESFRSNNSSLSSFSSSDSATAWFPTPSPPWAGVGERQFSRWVISSSILAQWRVRDSWMVWCEACQSRGHNSGTTASWRISGIICSSHHQVVEVLIWWRSTFSEAETMVCPDTTNTERFAQERKQEILMISGNRNNIWKIFDHENNIL